MEHRRAGRRRGGAGTFLMLYTAMWIACALTIYGLYRFHQRSFLYIYDGVFQHMPAFEYVQQYLRALLRGNAAAISESVLALSFEEGDAPEGASAKEWNINGEKATLSVRKA